ncbi:MAG TPA: M1 family aminopeptidase [Flavobacterium sp.]|nr:M1 family aminopeptidase [Flavobacterium sp.]
MKHVFFTFLVGFVSWFTTAQIAADATADYRLYEQKAIEKRLAFKQNPNTANYDVVYQKLELAINPSEYFIAGTVTTQFIPTENLQTIVFDLSHQLQVHEVKQGNTALDFLQASNEITIQLAQQVHLGNTGEVAITYSGMPPRANDAFTQSYHNGEPIIWTLSEPFGARDWFPCKQSLDDKIDSIDIYLKTPENLVAVANGLEQSQITHNDGTKTTHFKHKYPIPPYLVAIAVTNYKIHEQTAGSAPNTFPIVNYLYPETYDSEVNQLAVTLPIMDVFENLFGTYPFHTEKYGHAQFGWNGGMEHTTVSFMGSFSRRLIAHELAHHWFGDKITCGSWKDIWINEGFAEYMAGLVVEHLDGANAFIDWKTSKINNVISASGGNLYLTDEQALDSDRIFNARITYDKGSMVVHMLRYVLGDAVFYQGMRNFLEDPALAYSFAVTPQVKQHLEAASGTNLTEFFNAWIYGQGQPSYQLDAEYTASKVKIVLSQTTSHSDVSFFEMPVTVQLISKENQSEIMVLQHTQNAQEFVIDTHLKDIQDIIIDPFKDLISASNQVSIKEGVVESEDFKVFPNPSKTYFQVETPTAWEIQSINLYDAKGRLVAKNIDNSYQTEHLASGIYILSVETPERTYHKKVIKN